MDNQNDYVAHRVLLGTPRGIGLGTCRNIGDNVIANNLNYREIFYNNLPQGVFVAREVTAINKARTNIQATQNWLANDSLNTRNAEIEQLLLSNFTQAEVNQWRQFIVVLPSDITLDELKDYMFTDSQQNQDNIISSVCERLGQNNPVPALPPKIRIMTFHSSKGLSGKVVFIPGLEELVFPTARQRSAAGLILECARLFYVAITRSKAACILSYTRRRNLNGTSVQMNPSRYCAATGAHFLQQNSNCLSATDMQAIINCINNL